MEEEEREGGENKRVDQVEWRCGPTLDMAPLRVGLGTAVFLAPKRRFMTSDSDSSAQRRLFCWRIQTPCFDLAVAGASKVSKD